MTKRTFIAVICLTLGLTSCDLLQQVAKALPVPLTSEEIVSGLKKALEVGTGNSVVSASGLDGYYKNEVIKILLPEDVKKLQNAINTKHLSYKGVNIISTKEVYNLYVKANGGKDLFQELSLAMNRGAEKAATKAKPIFVDAIVGMSVTDGLNILQGNSTAATQYFQGKTQTSLVNAFQPELKTALDQTKANAIYGDIKGFLDYKYSYKVPILGSVSLGVNDFIKMDMPESIEGYATEKAVDGLFYLVGEEEKKIRANPFAWGSSIIERVFGSDEAKAGA